MLYKWTQKIDKKKKKNEPHRTKHTYTLEYSGTKRDEMSVHIKEVWGIWFMVNERLFSECLPPFEMIWVFIRRTHLKKYKQQQKQR